MRRGVTMWDPEQTYVDASVRLAEDVVLGPGGGLQGDGVVGAGPSVAPPAAAVQPLRAVS